MPDGLCLTWLFCCGYLFACMLIVGLFIFVGDLVFLCFAGRFMMIKRLAYVVVI